jgi:hypothetical protein
MTATWKDVQAIGKSLPGVLEGTSYGTPSLKAGKAFLTRLRPEGDAVVVPMPLDEREIKMQAAPDSFCITDHYRAWPTVLVRLSQVDKKELAALLTQAWRNVATRKMLAAFDEAAKPAPRKSHG